MNAPKEYRIDYDEMIYKEKYSKEILKDQNGNPIPGDQNHAFLFGNSKYFEQDDWKRYTIEDRDDYIEANNEWE